MSDLGIEVTPPHHPTYGVDLPEETVAFIVKHSLPHSTSPKISKLPHGKSFNNRIYLIECQESIDSEITQSYVLKVNGKFFGSSKVENEVACLLLIAKFCPDVPVPRVISWSGDGIHVSKCGDHDQLPSESSFGEGNPPGWIFMTRIPGDPIDASNLSDSDQLDLAGQLAKMVHSWRNNIPSSEFCGNVHFRPSSEPSLYLDSEIGLQLHIYGLLGLGNDDLPPINSLLDYWKAKLNHLIGELSSKSSFTLNREPLLPLLNKFVDEDLERLSIFKGEGRKFNFTHTDIAPRNVIVSGNPPKITGIIDLELSGFFPSIEEFIHDSLRYERGSVGGLPVNMYNEMLSRLESMREITPLSLKESVEWKELRSLCKLETFIAPWWLAEGGVQGEELKIQLDEARKEVEESIEALSRAI